MAKERTSSAFKAFLSGVNAVGSIQDKQSREEQAEKARTHADRLAEAQRKAVAMNLRKQIDANMKMQKERLAQSEKQFKEGLIHQTELTATQIQASLDNLNTRLAADKAARAAEAAIAQDYRRNQSYATAMGQKIQAKNQGIMGEVVPNAETGWFQFIPSGDSELTKTQAYKDLAREPLPTPSPYPDDLAMKAYQFGENILNISPVGQVATLGKSIMEMIYPEAGSATYSVRRKQETEKKDIKQAERYARVLEDVMATDDNAMANPNVSLGMNAVNTVGNRSEFSQKYIKTMEGPTNLQNVMARINLLLQANQQPK